ncbi:hypothetical protein cym2001_42020 [Pseudomonas sp. CYM-20-01]|nr:hypothetical protein cym2001_42020 [Pseudomonas sp. CYM-20-01]
MSAIKCPAPGPIPKPEVVAISTPLGIRNYQDHILNISLSTPQSIKTVVAQYAAPLMALADKFRASVDND